LPVTFAGQLTRNELAQADAAADIAIFPSVRAASGDQDGLPVALLEAMASGCAVIVSDLPGLDEAVVDGESGVIVTSGDALGLREAIGALLADPKRRLAMGRAAAKRAQAYDVVSVARDYLRVLRVAAGTHRSSQSAL
jgi:glycosyltransferase involved in cell wall biosynthesis